jgi:hypothetical protein
MDRNEKFKKRLENKLNQTLHKGSSKFDPTPYVNVIMDKIYWEDPDEFEESIDEINSNPDLDFILGRSSLLNLAQKQLVVNELQHRLTAIFEFDPKPFAEDLLQIWQTNEFDKYQEVDENGVDYDFSEFYEKNKLTKEQSEMVSDCFFEQLEFKGIDGFKPKFVEKDIKITKKDVFVTLSLVLVFVIIPACLIPNYLQKTGWLYPSAGWFMKIAIFIMSAIGLLFIWRKVLDFIAIYVFKLEK